MFDGWQFLADFLHSFTFVVAFNFLDYIEAGGSDVSMDERRNCAGGSAL